MIKLIIFDLDDTLIDSWNTSIPIKLKISLQEMIKAGLKIEDEEESLKLLIDLNNSEDNGEKAIKKFLKQIGDEKENEKIFQIGNEAYYGGPLLDLVRPPLLHTMEVLNLLHKSHKLAMVTHGNEKVQYDKIKLANIDKSLFSKILVTRNYDKSKSYQQILDEFGFKPQEIIVIGDKYKTDLLPAKKLGMKTVHMKWGKGKIMLPKKGEVDFIISDLIELPKIIERFQ